MYQPTDLRLSVVAGCRKGYGEPFGLMDAQHRLSWETYGCHYSCSMMQTLQVLEIAGYVQQT